MNAIVEVQNNARKQAIKLGISKRLDKQIELFKENPKLPGLNVEKLEPRRLEHWSFRINRQYRARFVKLRQRTIRIITVEDYH